MFVERPTNFPESIQTPITLDGTSSQYEEAGPTFTAYGINLRNEDIDTLTEGEMINDNIVTILFILFDYFI